MVTVGRMSPGICPTPLPKVSLVSEATGGSRTCNGVVEDGDVAGEGGTGPHGRRRSAGGACPARWGVVRALGHLHPRRGPLGQGKVVKDGCNPLPLTFQHLPNRARRNGARTGGDRRSMLGQDRRPRL